MKNSRLLLAIPLLLSVPFAALSADQPSRKPSETAAAKNKPKTQHGGKPLSSRSLSNGASIKADNSSESAKDAAVGKTGPSVARVNSGKPILRFNPNAERTRTEKGME